MIRRTTLIVAVLSLALLVPAGAPAKSETARAQTNTTQPKVLAGAAARQMIATQDPEVEIQWCRRKMPAHVRCLVSVFIVVEAELIDEATGAIVESRHPVSRTPVPMWADVGLKGIHWSLAGALGEED